MGAQAIEGGYDTTRITTTADDQRRRADQQSAARRNLSATACDRYPGAWDGNPEALRAARAWRDEIAAALGLSPRKATA